MNYREYLKTKTWLLKKHELISFYIKNDFNIECVFCGTENELQVHHWSYGNLGNEEMSQLTFACAECHKRWHFEKGFKDIWLDTGLDDILAHVNTQ